MKYWYLLLLLVSTALVSCVSEESKLDKKCDQLIAETEKAQNLEDMKKISTNELVKAVLKDSIYANMDLSALQPKLFKALHMNAVKFNEMQASEVEDKTFYFSVLRAVNLGYTLLFCTTVEEVDAVDRLNQSDRAYVDANFNQIFDGALPLDVQMCIQGFDRIDNEIRVRREEILNGNLYDTSLFPQHN